MLLPEWVWCKFMSMAPTSLKPTALSVVLKLRTGFVMGIISLNAIRSRGSGRNVPTAYFECFYDGRGWINTPTMITWPLTDGQAAVCWWEISTLCHNTQQMYVSILAFLIQLYIWTKSLFLCVSLSELLLCLHSQATTSMQVGVPQWFRQHCNPARCCSSSVQFPLS